MGTISEYKVEELFIERLKSIGYEYADLKCYEDVLKNFRKQLCKLNADKLIEKKGSADISDKEFERLMIHVDNKSVYESAKILRDKYILQLDNGKTVYLDFFTSDSSRNIFQVAHQITMDPAHKSDVSYKNRYDVTVLINGLPLIQIELKRPGVEINEAINQINRYRKFSFKGLFRYLQLFVVSNSVQTKYFCNENEMQNGQYRNILKSLVFFWTDDKNDRINDLQEFTTDFFRKTFITDMIAKYMVIKTTEDTLMVMRPYQIYAVQAAKKRVLEVNRDGFVFACTGSGKTLTSFKLAQLLRDESAVDRVIFLIDRKDLDDQTIDEYNSFEKDCVDRSTNTYALTKRLEDDTQKLIVTTIQKLANAANSPKFNELIEKFRKQKVIFIIDECHRSQFGKMHADIARRFENANYVGFTGTPIFKENMGSNNKTTADIFSAGKDSALDSCLHKYMIKNAIADGNVLKFSVEYQRSMLVKNVAAKGIDPDRLDDPEYCRIHNVDINSLYHDPQRIKNIAEHIFNNYFNHTHPQGEGVYTAMFAVDQIPTLGMYYKEFKRINEAAPADKKLKIAAIFTYQANEDMDEGVDEHSQELLDSCIKDYNAMFGTSFGIDTFDAYRKDIQKRLKQKEVPQVDLLIVVNMFLTGFDAKPLNTLYLDKNLVWHSLLQAYSRTNRVDKASKQFGQIITYRNIKKAQDDALKLFSGDGNPDEYLLNSYEYYTDEWRIKVGELMRVVPDAAEAGHLQSEDDIKRFILSFRAVSKLLAILKTFSKFDWKDLSTELDEDEYEAYKSWYLYYYDILKKENDKDKVPVPVDVDFDIDLIRTDKINVVYILNLLKEINRKDTAEMKRSVDLILREIERSDNEALRYKRDVMRDFINNRFFTLDSEADIILEYEQFEKEALLADLERIATELKVDEQKITKLFYDYTFTSQITDDDIRIEIEYMNLGLLQSTRLIKLIKQNIKELYNKYKAEGK
ncbi:MAG: type I restriction endonuclease subunit R [Saccharofermentans sp.]|nr:type I restriction endonuclease subunit R [Saccharofermentans sp.]